MKFLTFLKLLLIFLVINSCNSQAQEINDGAKIFTKFPLERKVKSKDFKSLKNYSVDRMSLVRDSVLLLLTANMTNQILFINALDSAEMGHMIKSGRKKGEVMGFFSYGVIEDNLWVYDIVKSKVVTFDFKSLLNQSTRVDTIYDVNKNYYAAQLVDKYNMIATGDYDSAYWLSLYNLPLGEVTNQFAPYTTGSEEVSKTTKTAYESILHIKPSRDKCVMSARYSDRIQILSLDNKSSKIILGPENYEPDVIVMEDHLGEDVSARGPQTRYALVTGATTDQFIYLLYSGNNHQGKYRSYGKYIYKYDWEGNPIERLELPEYTRDFAVTSDDRIIYTYDPKDKVIKKGVLGDE